MNIFVSRLLHFPIFWYRDSLSILKRFFKNLIIFLDNKLAVSLMFKLLLVPLFHDTSLVGRLLSFIFRFFRIILGGSFIGLVTVSIIFWMILWISLPILILVILGSDGVLMVGVGWLVDFILRVKKTRLEKYLKIAKNKSEYLKELIGKDKEVLEILGKIETTKKDFKELKLILIVADWEKMALSEVQVLNDQELKCEHFLLALLKHNDWRYKEAVMTIEWMSKKMAWSKTPFLWDKDFEARPMGGVNRGWTGLPTPTLDKYSSDLTKKALKASLPEILEKKEIIAEIINILGRKEMNNVLVIGEPGSGKTTLIKGIAQEIVRGVSSPSLKFKRLVILETSRLASSATGADLNYRITKIIDEISKAENIILFVDEVHYLSSINKSGPETSDLFMALEPALSEGKFQFIGTTSGENYKKYIEPNEAFARLFDKVALESANKKQTMSILQYVAFTQELSEKVEISTLALLRIIELADRLIHDREFPDKAINLLDEVVSQLKTNQGGKVTVAMVEKLVSQKTKVPVSSLSLKDKKLLLNLETKLHQRVVGQDPTIKAVANAIRRARTNLKNEDKPIASFMFAGPTGVGKTETAKTLAQEFFGSEDKMIRLDMSEYQTLDSLNRLIGTRPEKGEGSSGGQLTEAVRHQPYSLILLDEIEKAHPNIINIFLQVLDDARLTDGEGRLIDFSNTIIIATTNVETREILEKHYSPEFLNRFTDLIVFKTLTEEEIKEVVELKLKKLINNLKNQEIEVQIDESLITQLATQSFSKKWGGREADRVIQKKIMNVIAHKILIGEIKKKKLFVMNELG